MELISRMQIFNKIFFFSFFLIFSGFVYSQCDYIGSVSVSTSGFQNGVGYTQEYVLVNDATDAILAINSTGNFTSLDGGDYRIYAVNYSGARPTEIVVSSLWASFVSNISSYCASYIGPYSGSAVSVCEQICGTSISVSTTGYTSIGSYSQLYVLVNSSGNIVASNTTGNFTGLASGNYSVYAVNTDNVSLKTEVNDLGLWSEVPILAASVCADILGPKNFSLTEGPEATFEVIPNCAGVNNSFNISIEVTSLGDASSVNIKNGITTLFSAVGLGTYTATGYTSGSLQTITVEDAANPLCNVSQTGLTFTCLDLGACSTTSASTTLLSQGFEGGLLPAGWSNTYASGTTNWQFVNGGRAGNNPTSPYAGSFNACFWKDDFNTDATYLVTPVLNFTGCSTNPQLTFWQVQNNWS
jgi:hypothetical protein